MSVNKFSEFYTNMQEENEKLRFQNEQLRKMLALVCMKLEPGKASVTFPQDIMRSLPDYEFNISFEPAPRDIIINWRRQDPPEVRWELKK